MGREADLQITTSTSTLTAPPPPPAPTALAPGFRFHPTDEELVIYYLKRKVCRKPYKFNAISEVDIYKSEPWDLADKSSLKSRDQEYYFFSALDRKYGNGARMNRATNLGYWKATGNDRTVKHNDIIVGMKKTLVFHSGRAPDGKRTNWVMHEYRLVDEVFEKAGLGAIQDAFVLCRVFHKSNIGPPSGHRYAPFVEEEWDDDEKLTLVPGQETRNEPVAGRDAFVCGNGHAACSQPNGHVTLVVGNGHGALVVGNGHAACSQPNDQAAYSERNFHAAHSEQKGHGALVVGNGQGALVVGNGHGALVVGNGHSALVEGNGHSARVESNGHGARVESNGHGARVEANSHGARVEANGHGARVEANDHGAPVEANGHGTVIEGCDHEINEGNGHGTCNEGNGDDLCSTGNGHDVRSAGNCVEQATQAISNALLSAAELPSENENVLPLCKIESMDDYPMTCVVNREERLVDYPSPGPDDAQPLLTLVNRQPGQLRQYKRRRHNDSNSNHSNASEISSGMTHDPCSSTTTTASTEASMTTTTRNFLSALVEYQLLESLEPKDTTPEPPPEFSAALLESSVPPSCLKYLETLQNEIHKISIERETLKFEMMSAQAMINILQARIDLLNKENEDLKRSV